MTLILSFFVVSCEETFDNVAENNEEQTEQTEDNDSGESEILTGGLVEMVFVEGGTFARTNPDHEVTVRSFYIAKYELTQSKWTEVTGENPSKEFIGDQLPVNSMSWYKTIEFCNTLSIKEGLEPYYTVDKNTEDPNNLNDEDTYKWTVTINEGANGYCIPTEAQWEWAARGGVKHQGYNYAGSNNIDEVGWYRGNAEGTTHPVGEKLPNELGIYDMTGNAWEWCWDWCPDWRDETMPYDYEEGSKLVDPTGVESGSQKAIRGTCWMMSDGESSYITYRCNTRPYMGDKTMTVRLVRITN